MIAAEAAEALELSHRHEGPIDIVVTDMGMPHLDDVAFYAGQKISTMPISHNRPDVLHEMERVSRQPEFLPCPFTPEDLTKPCEQIVGEMTQHTILIIEDDAFVRNVLVPMLTLKGYRVLKADSAIKALEVSKTYEGIIDLLVVDHRLKAMTGREVAEKICGTRPGLKVLQISGYSLEILKRDNAVIPGAEFLAKPFTANVFMRKITILLKPFTMTAS